MKVKEYGKFKLLDELKREVSRISSSVVLASGSIERKKILEDLGLFVYVIKTDAKEEAPLYADPSAVAVANAKLKMDAFESKFAKEDCYPCPIITSDTVISVKRKDFLKSKETVFNANPYAIIGKPENEEDAFLMLKQLRDAGWHTVTSSVVVWYPGVNECEIAHYDDSADVFFKKGITDDMLREYVKTGEYFGAAGAYRIQGEGAKLFECVVGDISTVRGLSHRALYDAFSILNDRLINAPYISEYDILINT